jgi:hypothetical protein
MNVPKAFISYSHDSEAHKQWVVRLASDLRSRGIDASLDQWDLTPGQDIAAFMEHSVTSADRVLIVCTERYVEKANTGHGGVGYERLIVSGEIVNRIDTKKFVPIIRQTETVRITPRYLGSRLYIDFSADDEYDARMDELVREIHGLRPLAKPPLGVNPYASVPPASAEPARLAGPSGLTAAGHDILADGWFENHARAARDASQRHGRNAGMEVRLALHAPVRKSQLQLLAAVRESEIHTFGWPLAVTLENRDEYRPRSLPDGIKAEIAIAEKGLSGERSYDYWVARTNGDFYTLQSLFEDERSENTLFFNTRIVRIAEAFLFASRYFEKLGADPDSKVSVRIAHYGLAGRTLGSSSMNRHVFPRTTSADVSEAQVVATVSRLRAEIVENVMQVAAPMFMLFDFAEFADTIYADIVRKYEQGQVT